jgi:hypothetical protein
MEAAHFFKTLVLTDKITQYHNSEDCWKECFKIFSMKTTSRRNWHQADDKDKASFQNGFVVT